MRYKIEEIGNILGIADLADLAHQIEHGSRQGTGNSETFLAGGDDYCCMLCDGCTNYAGYTGALRIYIATKSNRIDLFLKKHTETADTIPRYRVSEIRYRQTKQHPWIIQDQECCDVLFDLVNTTIAGNRPDLKQFAHDFAAKRQRAVKQAIEEQTKNDFDALCQLPFTDALGYRRLELFRLAETGVFRIVADHFAAQGDYFSACHLLQTNHKDQSLAEVLHDTGDLDTVLDPILWQNKIADLQTLSRQLPPRVAKHVPLADAQALGSVKRTRAQFRP